jgi:methyl-accepting chemotaxis protein
MLNLHLSNRLVRYLGLGSLILLIVMMSVIGWRQLRDIESHFRYIAEEHRVKLNSIDNLLSRFVEIRGQLTAFVIEEKEDVTPILKDIKLMLNDSETLLQTLHHKEDRQAMELFIQKLKEYRTAMVAYSQELLIRRTGEGVRSWERTLLDIEREAHAIVFTMKSTIIGEVGELEDQMLQTTRSATQSSIALGLFGVLLALVVVFLLQRALARPIRKLVNMSESVAEGDLSRDIERIHDEELGPLSDSIKTMVENLQQTVGGIRTTATRVTEVAHGVSHHTNDLSSGASIQGKAIAAVHRSIEEMDVLVEDVSGRFNSLAEALDDSSSSTLELKSSIEEVSDFADRLSEEVEKITSSLLEMSATMAQNLDLLNSLSSSSHQTAQVIGSLASSSEEVGEHAQQSKTLAEEVTQLARDQGLVSLKELIEVAKTNKKLVDSYSKVIHSLGERSVSIGEILDVIHDVADQTSLLAINASIIAAQAGEHGKGFAVVAEEVGDLSSTTTASVMRVEEVIRSVRQDVANAVEMMGQVSEGAEQSIKTTEKAGEVLKSIEEHSLLSATRAGEIADAAGQQVARSKEILEVATRNLDEVVRIQEAVDEQKKGSDLIVSSAENIRETAISLKLSTDEQIKESAVISQAVVDTQTFSHRIKEAMDGEKKASKEIVASLNSITNTTENIRKALDALEELVVDLTKLADQLGPEVARFKLAETSREAVPSI